MELRSVLRCDDTAAYVNNTASSDNFSLLTSSIETSSRPISVVSAASVLSKSHTRPDAPYSRNAGCKSSRNFSPSACSNDCSRAITSRRSVSSIELLSTFRNVAFYVPGYPTSRRPTCINRVFCRPHGSGSLISTVPQFTRAFALHGSRRGKPYCCAVPFACHSLADLTCRADARISSSRRSRSSLLPPSPSCRY